MPWYVYTDDGGRRSETAGEEGAASTATRSTSANSLSAVHEDTERREAGFPKRGRGKGDPGGAVRPGARTGLEFWCEMGYRTLWQRWGAMEVDAGVDSQPARWASVVRAC